MFLCLVISVRSSSSTLAIFTATALLYGVVVLWYVATSPDAGLRCLLSNDVDTSGVEIRVGPKNGLVTLPKAGDILVEFHGRPVRSFVDFAWAHAALRYARIDSGGALPAEANPKDLGATSELTLVEYPDQLRYVKVRFRRPGADSILTGWLQLERQSALRIGITLFWFILQTGITLVSGIAAWQRPFDRSLKLFCILSGLTLIAFVGGDHWWVISGRLALILPFAVAGILLPAVLLHFFLVYPTTKPALLQRPHTILGLIYAGPVIMSLATVAVAVAGSWLSGSWGEGPFGLWMTRTIARGAIVLMNLLQGSILAYLSVSLLYFGASLAAMAESLVRVRDLVQRRQVQSILWAGMAASIPVGYALYLALFRPQQFALGASQIPMFIASLLFMVAYAVGIARFKLLLIDQVLSRGMWYFVLSGGLGFLFSAAIGVGSVALHSQNASLFGQPVPMVIVLTLVVFGLLWSKDRMQRSIDREFFREKYQLDRALLRMNRAVSNLWGRDAVAGNLLGSCCEALRVEQAALYLWVPEHLRFKLASAVGWPEAPATLPGSEEQLKLLGPGNSIQRVPSADSGDQVLVRAMNAELITGLEVDGELAGFVALGRKPSGAAFTAEDVAFLTAMGRITGVALHCAKVHEEISRLNEDLQAKTDKLVDQERRISMLQGIVNSVNSSPRPLAVAGELQRSTIKGNGPAITQVLETVRKVAASEASVLVRGESGTGKELLARTIHENSPRKAGPLVAVHCAALSPQLLESELFGHVKGAFTDAREDKPGRFAMAHGGTLFLDEIGDISLDVQIKLLRVLQERTFEPVGSSVPVEADVRVIAATHQNLERLIAEGKFREDLYYRLNVISVTLPPLRERKEDLLELAMHFLAQSAQKSGRPIGYFDEAAIEALTAYSWPGNIRELHNVIERSVVMSEGGQITVAELPLAVARATFGVESPRLGHEIPRRSSSNFAAAERVVIGSADEKQQLIAALERCGGNKAEAARLMGIPRSTFFSRLRRHGLG